MSTLPLVSVLLPVRNGRRWLEECLQSLRSQTIADVEVLVIDDGSDDGSGELAAAFDSRVRVARTPGVGVAASLNLGLSLARGVFCARQDADDYSEASRFERQVARLEAEPSLDVLATRTRFVDEAGQPVASAWTERVTALHDPAISPAQIDRLLPLTCCLVHGSVMLRASAVRAAGGYSTTAAAAEDYDLWLRLWGRRAFAKLPERLYVHRLHDGQVSQLHRHTQLRSTVRAKLQLLRRVVARDEPLRLRITGEGRGAAAYRAAAHDLGFTLSANVDGAQSTPNRLDVLVVTDLATLPDVQRRLRPEGWRWLGNLGLPPALPAPAIAPDFEDP